MQYVYTTGWGRNTSLGVNNGHGKMVVSTGPHSTACNAMQSTEPRCCPRNLLATWMANSKRPLCWSSVAVRVDLQRRNPPHVLAKIRGLSSAATLYSQSPSHMHQRGVVILSDTLVSASILSSIHGRSLEPHPTLLYMLAPGCCASFPCTPCAPFQTRPRFGREIVTRKVPPTPSSRCCCALEMLHCSRGANGIQITKSGYRSEENICKEISKALLWWSKEVRQATDAERM